MPPSGFIIQREHTTSTGPSKRQPNSRTSPWRRSTSSAAALSLLPRRWQSCREHSAGNKRARDTQIGGACLKRLRQGCAVCCQPRNICYICPIFIDDTKNPNTISPSNQHNHQHHSGRLPSLPSSPSPASLWFALPWLASRVVGGGACSFVGGCSKASSTAARPAPPPPAVAAPVGALR